MDGRGMGSNPIGTPKGRDIRRIPKHEDKLLKNIVSK